MIASQLPEDHNDALARLPKRKRPQPSLKNWGRHSNAPSQGGDDDWRQH